MKKFRKFLKKKFEKLSKNFFLTGKKKIRAFCYDEKLELALATHARVHTPTDRQDRPPPKNTVKMATWR